MSTTKCPECGWIRTAVEKDRFCWKCGLDFWFLEAKQEAEEIIPEDLEAAGDLYDKMVKEEKDTKRKV